MDCVSCAPLSQRDSIMSLWKELYAQYGCERRAAEKAFPRLPETLQQKAKAAYEDVRFHRRRYGRSDFYCWANHCLFENDLLDPWPSNRFPRAVLLMELAKRIADEALVVDF